MKNNRQEKFEEREQREKIQRYLERELRVEAREALIAEQKEREDKHEDPRHRNRGTSTIQAQVTRKKTAETKLDDNRNKRRTFYRPFLF